MKYDEFPQNEMQGTVTGLCSTESAGLSQSGLAFAPPPGEVARKAYFSYVNAGSRQGHDVQHWLAAEAELIAERNENRAHGFQN
jgi:hypothetical protein